ncbi:MAG: RimK/LysX family protein [Planctomycetota bacterium]
MPPQRRGALAPILIPSLVLLAAATMAALKPGVSATGPDRTVLGPVVKASENESGLPLVARVDTGAKTSSIHFEDYSVEGGAERMEDNIGKRIRFRVRNKAGEAVWLEREIREVATIRTSEREEKRYKVLIDLETAGVGKQVLVSLNDRSRMNYALLLGRNFLRDDFLVNVDL